MSTSFSFDAVDRCTAGAVGEPGLRVFFLQVGAEGQIVTLLAEKEQIGALATTIARLLSILPESEDPVSEPSPGDLDLQEPLVPEWRCGAMALDFDEESQRLVLIVQEAVPEESEEEPASLRVSLRREQAQSLAEHAAGVVAAGRPQCRVCGLPMDPAGHTCPATNGHKKQS